MGIGTDGTADDGCFFAEVLCMPFYFEIVIAVCLVVVLVRVVWYCIRCSLPVIMKERAVVQICPAMRTHKKVNSALAIDLLHHLPTLYSFFFGWNPRFSDIVLYLYPNSQFH